MSDVQITPSLAEFVLDAIDSKMLDIHTAIPGIVVKFDAEKQLADIQPALKRKFSETQIEPLPVVTNVPVVYPRSSNSIIYFPLVKGDSVLLLFAERSIDRWISKGGIVDPADVRKHHLSDGICVPGLFPSNKAFSVSKKENLCIEFGDAILTLSQSGKFKIGSKSTPSAEVIDILSKTLQELSIAQTAAGPLLNAAQFAALKVLIDQLKEA